jgi:flagellar protein FlaI
MILLLILFLFTLYRIQEIHIGPYVLTSSSLFPLFILYSSVATILYLIALYIHVPVKPVEEEEVTPVVVEEREEPYPFIEIYEIRYPFVYVGIVKKEEAYEYRVLEPELNEEEQRVKEEIEKYLYEELEIDRSEFPDLEEAKKYLISNINNTIIKYGIKVSKEGLEKIVYYIVRDHLEYGKIDVLMKDENVEDISCNGPNMPVYVWHRFYESIPTNIVFNEEELDNFVTRLAYISGRHVSISTPIVDATLPDGARIHITYRKEVSRKGSTFSIRKFRAEPYTIIDLIKLHTLDEDIAAYLWYIIENNASVLVAGGTASGKTTLLNALSLFIRPEKKIVSIEDTAELQLYHENWNPMVERTGFGIRRGEAEIRMFELLKAALRQRPDIIIVGEVRGEEAYTMFQAMATGHGGLGSIHAEDPMAVINRLTSEPMNIPKALIPTLDSIVLISRMKIGDRIVRKVTNISEPMLDRQTGELRINNVYTYDLPGDRYIYGGKSICIENICKVKGIPTEQAWNDIKRRRTILKWMLVKDMRSFTEFVDIIRRYYMNPDEVYDIAIFELMAMGRGSEA